MVLGLFPAGNFRKVGVVDFDQTGRVHKIIEKPQHTDLKYMWAIAVWSPQFTQFLHEYLANWIPEKELPVGDVIQAAIEAGLQVEAEPFPTGSYLDVGTPGDLATAIRDLTPQLDE